jgi:hypothetical protein
MIRIWTTSLAALALVSLATSWSGAGWLDKAKQAAEGLQNQATSGPAGGLSSDEIAGGLREALRIGAEKAASRASAVGGFLDNPKIRIPLPDQLQTAANAAKMVGMGSHVAAFEDTMNRAAEKASAKAVPIFGDAVSKLTFEDVEKIWKGGDRAATDYLERTTRDRLYAEFEPVVHAAAGEVGVTRSYESLIGQPGVSNLVAGTDLDLDHYVTGKGLDGLFTLLGEEEKAIRTNPMARTTDLLKKVFGQ